MSEVVALCSACGARQPLRGSEWCRWCWKEWWAQVVARAAAARRAARIQRRRNML